MIRKHSALAIRYTNDVGVEEALYYIGGYWRLGGYVCSYSGEFQWIDETINGIIEDTVCKDGYSDSAVETWTGMPINIVKSKLRLREWTTNFPVYGVPF